MPNFQGGTTAHRTRNDRTTRYLRITAGPQRDQYVHILVAEAKIGRKLLPDETVEHKNGDGLDCDPGNLIVVTRSENSKLMHERRKGRGETAAEPEPEPPSAPADTSFDTTTF